MNKDLSGWEIIEDRIYESFPIFTLIRSTRVNPVSRARIDFVRVEGLEWVNVIALTHDQQLVLVRQYRHGLENFTLELPGGCIEKEEPDPQKSGMRELLEETGYTSDRIEYVGALYPNPAMYTMKNFFYLAKDCQLVKKQELDSGEDIEVILKPLDEVYQMLMAGEFNHGMCSAALMMARLKEMI